MDSVNSFATMMDSLHDRFIVQIQILTCGFWYSAFGALNIWRATAGQITASRYVVDIVEEGGLAFFPKRKTTFWLCIFHKLLSQYKLFFMEKFQLWPILTLLLQNHFQIHYRKICWTENYPIFAKAFMENVVIEWIESHDYYQVEWFCPDTESISSHQVLRTGLGWYHRLETDGQIPFSARAASL